MLKLFHDSDHSQVVRDGDALYSHGDPADMMFVVLTGTVEIRINGQLIEQVTRGGMVGEVAMLDNGVHAADAVAVGECHVEPITRKRFNFLVQQTPYFAIDMMRAMAERMHRNLEQLSDNNSMV